MLRHEMAAKILFLLPYAILVGFFFITNPGINRGERGELIYALTKCLPVTYLGIIALFAFRPPVTPLRTGLGILDKIAGFRHPAALTFFLTAAVDWFLSNRSNSQFDYALALVPFGVLVHFLNTRFWSSNLTSGQRYWWGAVLFVVAYNLIMCSVTAIGILEKANTFLQLSAIIYKLFLAWGAICAISNWWYDPSRHTNRITLLYKLGFCGIMIRDTIMMVDDFGIAIPRAQFFALIACFVAQALIFLSFAEHDVKAKGY